MVFPDPTWQLLGAGSPFVRCLECDQHELPCDRSQSKPGPKGRKTSLSLGPSSDIREEPEAATPAFTVLFIVGGPLIYADSQGRRAFSPFSLPSSFLSFNVHSAGAPSKLGVTRMQARPGPELRRLQEAREASGPVGVSVPPQEAAAAHRRRFQKDGSTACRTLASLQVWTPRGPCLARLCVPGLVLGTWWSSINVSWRKRGLTDNVSNSNQTYLSFRQNVLRNSSLSALCCEHMRVGTLGCASVMSWRWEGRTESSLGLCHASHVPHLVLRDRFLVGMNLLGVGRGLEWLL